MMGPFLSNARGLHYRVYGRFVDQILPSEEEEKAAKLERMGADGELLRWDKEKAKAIVKEFEVRDRDAKLILEAIQTQGQFRAVDRFWLDDLRVQLGEDLDLEEK